MKPYEIKYTALAIAVLGESKSAFEEQARGELADHLPEGFYPPEVIMQAFRYNGREFIGLGMGDHIVIDTATYEEQEPLKEGPFKGKTPMIPMPDTDPDEM